MRNLLLGLGIAVVGGMAACGGDDTAPPIDENIPKAGSGGKGTGGTKSTGGTSDAGAGGEAPMADGPLVQITTPAAAPTPADAVLTAETVSVLCKVEKATATAPSVDAATVVLVMTDEMGEETEKEATSTGDPDEFGAEFVLTTVPTGQVTFTCSARDVEKNQGTNSIATFVDHGPTITVTTPTPDGAYPLKGGLAVEFEVTADPLTDDDPGAEVDTVSFKLDDREFEVEELSPGKFKTTLMLDDVETFPQAPSGAIGITATNKRDPEPVTKVMDYNILIDGTGPVITIKYPTPQKVVGGKVVMEFTVTDVGSGVSPESVNVTLYSGDEARRYNPNQGWKIVGQTYFFTFDTKEIEPHANVQTTINVRASDLVENQSASGQSVQIYLDNVPPKIDLDPRNIRTTKAGTCSRSFDPVGSKPLNDLAGQFGTPAVARMEWLRAFVLEQTNAGGQDIVYYAGTDQTQVRLYVQADPTNAATKLLVNKNPGTDNTCDDIGGIDAVESPPLFSRLHAMPKSSATNVWRELDPGVEPSEANICTLSDGSEPLHLCPANTSDLWYAPYNFPLNEPALYVVGQPGNDASCAGIDLGLLTANQPEGWVCVSARVVDNAGNVGIAPPLRVCVDDPATDPPPACRTSITTPPTCTDGCVPPARGGGVIIQGP
jgi:hypothetical protein